jgi:hypothetical protein
MDQPNDLMPIGWYIDRNPHFNPLNNDDNINLSNSLPDSINYNIIHDNINTNIRNINSPRINDHSYQIASTVSRIRFNRNVETSTNINSNEDFIPFDSSPPQNRGININISYFAVSEEDRQCCICMEERHPEEICRLNCQHTFCVECTNQHIQSKNACPVCRSSVTTLIVQNTNARDRIDL